MKIKFVKLGGPKHLKRELGYRYAKGIKLVWLAFYFFGIQISMGDKPYDLEAMIRAQYENNLENAKLPKIPEPTNRKQRRHLNWMLKKGYAKKV